MCTVTFFPLNNENFVLTSTRDVPFLREKAAFPKEYKEDGVELFYPKDGEAGGSWIGSSDKKRLICLLNGGFQNHKQKDFYAKSRGIIVKDLLKADDISMACKEIDLENVEPFTLVIVEWDLHLFLFEFVWDGKQKHLKILPKEPIIWSSSTLYTSEMKELRLQWFSEWISKFKVQSQKSKVKSSKFKVVKDLILEFHHKAGVGDPKIDIMMKRSKVGTVSITQVSKKEDDLQWSYEEIQ